MTLGPVALEVVYHPGPGRSGGNAATDIVLGRDKELLTAAFCLVVQYYRVSGRAFVNSRNQIDLFIIVSNNVPNANSLKILGPFLETADLTPISGPEDLSVFQAFQ